MMNIPLGGSRLYLPAREQPWWVGPDPFGAWHVALAPPKPHADSKTWAPAVCGTRPNASWIAWHVWQHQQPTPPQGARTCADCLRTAEQHDWPRPSGRVAREA